MKKHYGFILIFGLLLAPQLCMATIIGTLSGFAYDHNIISSVSARFDGSTDTYTITQAVTSDLYLTSGLLFDDIVELLTSGEDVFITLYIGDSMFNTTWNFADEIITAIDILIDYDYDPVVFFPGTSILQEEAYNEVYATLLIDSSPVPEPTSILLLGSGLAGFIAYRRKKH